MAKQTKTGSIKNGGKVFYYVMITVPVLQFLIFYVGVNFNSILMAFQKYDNSSGKEIVIWNFDNFKQIFSPAMAGDLLKCLKNSLIYFCVFFVNMPLSLLFAYYMYKRYFGSPVFKLVLFLPSIVCVTALVVFYKYFVNNGIGNIIGKSIIGPIYNRAQQPILILFYAMLDMSVNILLYINAFSRVSPAVMEAAEVDGANEIRAFINVIVPEAWGSVVSLFMVSLAGIATNQACLFMFFGFNANAEYQTIGYYLFNLVQDKGTGDVEMMYRLASALGLTLTLVIAPVAIIVRNALLKYGPSED